MIVQILIGALMMGSIYGVVGLGYSLIYKASGLLSLCQGDMLMLGAFLGLMFYKTMKLPFLVSLALTMIIMFFIGMMIERFIVTPLLQRGATLASIILATMAVAMVMRNSSMLIWATNVLDFPPLFKVATIKISGFNIVPESLVIVGAAFVGMVGLHFFMNKTKFGTSMRAAALDPKAASTMGINVPFTKGITWGISAALAGGIGVVVGPMMGVFSTMGVLIGLKGFSSAIVGGYGNMYGAITAGILFGFMEAFVAAYITSGYKDLITFLFLIIIMIFMPTGLFKAKVLE